jgi:P27 family predicted phage terminase small subunit
MARPPKPTVLKLLEGNRGKRPLNKREPVPDAKAPRCPEWLDAEAQDCWRRCVRLLHPIGLLTSADGDALTMYCSCYSRWKAAERVISEKGSTYDLKDNNGNVRCVQQRPEVAIARSLLDLLTKLAREFGATPSARSRIMVLPAKPKDSKWKGLLANAN